MKTVIKRDGREMNFNAEKIYTAIKKSIEDAYPDKGSKEVGAITANVTEKVYSEIKILDNKKIEIENIQNIIEKVLKEEDVNIQKMFSNHRKKRTLVREKKSDIMRIINKIGVETDRDNANVGNNFSAKLLRISSVANKWHNLAMIPKHLSKLHENGDLYFHDLDSYNLTTNCLNVDTGNILKQGFNTGYGTINPPQRISTAAELSCILLQSSQNDLFGGQSHVNFDNDMALFIPQTREEIRKEIEEIANALCSTNKEFIDKKIEDKLEKEIHQAMQAVVYNLNTMHSRAGSQVPFSSINIGIPANEDAALVCKIFLEEYEKGLGKGEQPIFPNIVFRVKEGVNREPQDPYYYLYELACRVASKRMNPMFMSLDADFNKEWYDKGVIAATMGCRTYIMSNINGEPGPVGRGNIAPATMNLPRIGILAKGDLDKFFILLNNRMELMRESLLHRYSVLKNLKVKDLPFSAGQKLMRGSENLTANDSIEPILKQGTWGIGFIGLAETLVALTGKNHFESEESRKLGLTIVQTIRNFCDKYKEIDKLNWSCYGTPAEGLSGHFIQYDKEKFGIIDGVTDKEYYTNSYHVPVSTEIGIKQKIDIEAPFHKICNAGHITYIELDDYPTPETIKQILDYSYKNTNISYMGINFHMRYCRDCGTRLDGNKQRCSCGSTNIQGISRVTGYLSLDERFGNGKLHEREDRISHTTGKHNY